jgi:hypothetical protein
MYIKLNNNVPELYSLVQLLRDNPDTSFPSVLSDELLAQYEVQKLNVLPAPKHDSRTHYLKESALYEVGGKWQMHYTAEPLPLSIATKNVKADRDRLLTETDWVVVKAYEMQSAVSQEWLSYRQQLRDLPTQPNFPHDTVWPTKP